MITKDEFAVILKKCRSLPPAKGMYLENDYISNLFLTVLDFQMNGKAVERAMNYYKKRCWNDVREFKQLKTLLADAPDNKENNIQLAQYLWGYKLWTRISLLRTLVAFFESIGVKNQVALREWARNSTFENDFQGRIRGMGLAIYNWLVMRQGVETVKPDVHLRRFVKRIVNHDFSDWELVEVLEGVAKKLCIKAYQLDWKIWEYQRKSPITPKPDVSQNLSKKKKMAIEQRGEYESEQIQRFVNDDEGYLKWVNTNPSGFVVNSYKKPTPDYLMLHRANCGTILQATLGPGNWTTSGYIKICSLDKTELKKWAEREVGGELQNCQRCKP